MIKIAALILTLVFLCSPTFAGVHEVLLDNVSNSLNDTLLRAGNEHVFEMRFRNLQTDQHFHTVNGFEISSEDGATWNRSYGGWRNSFDSWFNQAFIGWYSVDGQGCDTVRFGTVSFDSTRGLYPGWDSVAVAVIIGPTNVSDHGKHICIDSSFAPPGGIWGWGYINAPWPEGVIPEWSGPHCFTLIDCDQTSLSDEVKLLCGGCIGTVGNVDCDDNQIVDIGDLTLLIRYLFIKSTDISCRGEANVDGDPDNLVDISDITRLIDYFWGTHEPPGPCIP